MARARGSQLHNQYVKGLITEATALTFPENASFDELNFDLKRDGSRQRRRGIEREAGSNDTNSPGPLLLDISSSTIINQQLTIFKWTAVGGDPDLSLLVVQIGPNLYFFDAGVTPIVDGFRPERIEMDDSFEVTDGIGAIKCQFAVGKGKLFVAHPNIEPFYVVYNAQEDELSAVSIDMRIRDFEGVDDGLEVDERPSVLTNEHYYNLRNQGWVEEAVDVLKAVGQTSDDPVIAFKQYIAFYGERAFQF